ncbi:hypothetical protein GCM10022383_12690 [Microbacterium soli]|uniref:Siderophore-interacting protein n=2 Tax=Microbacterium soli TaxID=446075 RepID=A0ABP7N327_9MICO
MPVWARRRHRTVVAQRVMGGIAEAMNAGDLHGIRAMLHPRARLVIDSGRLPAAPAPHGDARAAAEALGALMRPGTTAAVRSVNGFPGLVLRREGRVVAVVVAEVRARRLSRIWVVCNPDKLQDWNR